MMNNQQSHFDLIPYFSSLDLDSDLPANFLSIEIDSNLSDSAAGLSSSSAITCFKIGGRLWKIGYSVHSIGITVVEKEKMVETFGYQYETALAEGIFLRTACLRRNSSYRVRWTNLAHPYECDYGPKVFRNKICLCYSEIAYAAAAEQQRKRQREQMRAAIAKFRADPSKREKERTRENLRQRQERNHDPASAIQRRQIDAERKRKASQKSEVFGISCEDCEKTFSNSHINNIFNGHGYLPSKLPERERQGKD
jgi:hypothetical protein